MKAKNCSIFFIFVLIAGCAGTESLTPSETMPVNTEMVQTGPLIYFNPEESDSTVQSLIESYRDSLLAFTERKVATASSDLTFEKPAYSLGYLLADILRFRASRELRDFVHIGITDEQSYKTYLKQGTITIGDMYQLLPYDNHLTVLSMCGKDIIALMEEIAAMGGAPVSGVRMSISDGAAKGVLVNAEVVDSSKTYLVATNSYLANGNGPFRSLHNFKERKDLDLLVRKAFIDYFKNQQQIEPVNDERIRE
mgnify:CR=1 FL=1